MGKRYCVIGDVARQRMWFDKEAEAVEHARGLIKAAGACHKEVKSLLVVQEQLLVELSVPPITVTRL